MKKLIWILIMITLMITGCNKKEDEIDAQTQEKLNKFDRIIADIKSYQKNNKREVGITIQDGIYIKDGERLNYYSVTALEGTTIADRVKIAISKKVSVFGAKCSKKISSAIFLFICRFA